MEQDKLVTIGKREKDGFAHFYADGEKTNARLYIWKDEDVTRLQKIGEKIYKEMEEKKLNSESVKSSKPVFKHRHTRLGYIFWAVLCGLAVIVCVQDAIYKSAWYWLCVPFMSLSCIVDTYMAIQYKKYDRI